MSRQAAGREADAFAQTLRRAIEARDLPLGRLQRHVERRGVTVGRSTLSYWQNGLRTPSGMRSFQIVEALEEVLHLPSGELTALILDFIDPIFTDRASRSSAFSADDGPMDVAKID